MNGLRIYLLEHCPILRAGLSELLASQPGVETLAAFATIDEADASIATNVPTVILVDVDPPDRDAAVGFEALAARGWRAPIVVLTRVADEARVRAAMQAGVSGYVLKDSDQAELVAALRAVHSGNRFVCGALARSMLSGPIDQRGEPGREIAHLITQREREVLTRIALGQSNKLSARDLGLSVKTVEKHRSNLMRKLNLHNTAAVTMFALRHGLVSHEDLSAPRANQDATSRASTWAINSRSSRVSNGLASAASAPADLAAAR
ncbi:MAG: response regulator transcription factor [Gammaproteobacteria bacterium]|nr:response regulator transcription factor [Gammaproteobacteria bacterium]